jgi:uncharacterized protein YcbK (DUF882 family)
VSLSKHFTVEEFLAANDPVKPSAEVLDSLQDLCELALEPLREALGRPLKISSGYRSPAYNKLIGGAPGSQHCAGIAADILMADDAEQIKAAAIASNIKGIGGIGIYPGRGFIHVDIRPRIGGKPTTWAQVKGKYQAIPVELKKAIKAHGGKI